MNNKNQTKTGRYAHTKKHTQNQRGEERRAQGRTTQQARKERARSGAEQPADAKGSEAQAGSPLALAALLVYSRLLHVLVLRHCPRPRALSLPRFGGVLILSLAHIHFLRVLRDSFGPCLFRLNVRAPRRLFIRPPRTFRPFPHALELCSSNTFPPSGHRGGHCAPVKGLHRRLHVCGCGVESIARRPLNQAFRHKDTPHANTHRYRETEASTHKRIHPETPRAAVEALRGRGAIVKTLSTDELKRKAKKCQGAGGREELRRSTNMKKKKRSESRKKAARWRDRGTKRTLREALAANTTSCATWSCICRPKCSRLYPRNHLFTLVETLSLLLRVEGVG